MAVKMSIQFRKEIALLLSLVGLAFSGWAEQVSSDLAVRAVNTLIAEEGQMECPIEGTVSSVRLCTATNGASFYVAKLAGGGFVVTSTDTDIDPIIAISSEPDLVEDPRNPLWAFLVCDMGERRESLPENNRSGAGLMSVSASDESSPAARWARLTSSGARLMGVAVKISDVRVSPLLKTKWGQSYVAGKTCYNYFTPGHYVCGCTATAASQILRYHKFPTEPVTPHEFLIEVDGMASGWTQYGGTYNWDQMPYVPNAKTTLAQRMAIGKLTYDVGLAVNDSYSRYLTWGYLSLFVDLCHEWGYAHATSFVDYVDDDDYGYQRSDYLTKQQLQSVLIPNLDAKLPVGVRIHQYGRNGHFVVADGYGYLGSQWGVHLNFGWDGASDAWYILPGKMAAGYTGISDLCGNIYPHGPTRGGIVSGRVLSSSTRKPVSGIVVTASNRVDNVVQYAKTDARGIYAFILPEREDPDSWCDDCEDDEDWNGQSGGDWDDDDCEDCYDDCEDCYDDYEEYWELDYDERNHLSFNGIEENGEYVDSEWVIYLENASTGLDEAAPTSYQLGIWDAKNYHDQNFYVRLYTVKFDANGGVGTSSRTCNVLGALPEPTRTGYAFDGWFTAAEGGDRVTATTEPAGNVTYYAHWTANTYTVTFEANGGAGSMEPMTFTYDEAQSLRAGAFVKGDSAFHGWSLTPRGLVAFVDGESVKNLTAVPDGVVTLYAVWYGDVVAAEAGRYIKAPIPTLGYDVPTDGQTPYTVVALGLPAGLSLRSNAAVKDKRGRVIKKAKVEWWIEGVPTADSDYATNPAYLVITANGRTETVPLYLETLAQDVVDLGELDLGASVNTNDWLAGVGAGWAVSGLPTGLNFAAKRVTKKSGTKTVTVAEAYSVYGRTTRAGLFTITAKRKTGAYYETKKFRVLVRPDEGFDKTLFGHGLADMTTMAYEPLAKWDLMSGEVFNADGECVDSWPGVSAEAGVKVAKVTGLPAGLTFAAADTYAYANAKRKTGRYLRQAGQTIVGTPTRPGTYVVTFTKNVQERVKGKLKTVARTAQVLWKVEPNGAEPSLDGFNDGEGGVVKSGVVGLRYGDLLAFSATEGASVTASGLPSGIRLADLGGGNYAFTGFTAKAGTYLVTVTATLKGKTVRKRLALKVEGLPEWATGTYSGRVVESALGPYPHVATLAVSAAGRITGKFQDRGTNWTVSAASYDVCDAGAYCCTGLVARYAYKERVGRKTVTKYLERTFGLAVRESDDLEPARGVARLDEICEEGACGYSAYQNVWGRPEFKALGAKLFYTSKKLPYRTWGNVDADGVEASDTLSVKVTPAGAVTATLTVDTGRTTTDRKTRKRVKVYYKTSYSAVLFPTTAANAEPFGAAADLYFAPSPANGFPGLCVTVDYPFGPRVTPGPGESINGHTGEFTGHGSVQFPADGGGTETLNGIFEVNVGANLLFTGVFKGTDGTSAPFSGRFVRGEEYGASGVPITVGGAAMSMWLGCAPIPFGDKADGAGEIAGGNEPGASDDGPSICLEGAWQNIWKRADISGEWKPSFAEGTEKRVDLSTAGYAAGDALTYAFGAGGKVSVTGSVYGEAVDVQAQANLTGASGGTAHFNLFFISNGHLFRQLFTVQLDEVVSAGGIKLVAGDFSRLD